MDFSITSIHRNNKVNQHEHSEHFTEPTILELTIKTVLINCKSVQNVQNHIEYAKQQCYRSAGLNVDSKVKQTRITNSSDRHATDPTQSSIHVHQIHHREFLPNKIIHTINYRQINPEVENLKFQPSCSYNTCILSIFLCLAVTKRDVLKIDALDLWCL